MPWGQDRIPTRVSPLPGHGSAQFWASSGPSLRPDMDPWCPLRWAAAQAALVRSTRRARPGITVGELLEVWLRARLAGPRAGRIPRSGRASGCCAPHWAHAERMLDRPAAGRTDQDRTPVVSLWAPPPRCCGETPPGQGSSVLPATGGTVRVLCRPRPFDPAQHLALRHWFAFLAAGR